MNIPRTSIFALCFLAGASFSYSQMSHPAEKLSFHSTFEASVFNALSRSEPSQGFSIMLASNPGLDDEAIGHAKSSLEQIFQDLEGMDIRNKPLGKSVKIIYKYVQKKWLRKYTTLITFDEIFNSGLFNCVTASALYALIMEHFEIPYNLQLQPHHVYLLIDPEGKKIILESTDPLNGVVQVTDKEKEDQIKLLVRAKLISEEEAASKPSDDLYREYYLGKTQTIDLIQLASAQYYNLALMMLSQKKFSAGLALLEKSDYLLKVPRNQYLMLVCLYKLMLKMDYTAPEGLDPLFKLFALKPTFEVANELVRQFAFISEQFLFKYPDSARFENYYEVFKNKIGDGDILTSINEIYYVQKARAAHLNFNNDEALHYIELAYVINPLDTRIKRLLAEIVLDKLQSLGSGQMVIDRIESMALDYPFLLDNPQIKLYRSLAMIEKTADKPSGERLEEILSLLENPDLNKAEKNGGFLTNNLKIPESNGLLHYYSYFNRHGGIIKWLRNSLQFDNSFEVFNRILKVWDSPESVVLNKQPATSVKLH